MRTFTIFVALIMLSSLASAAELTSPLKPRNVAWSSQNDEGAGSTLIPTPEERRCAYLGKWGSFHIIGPKGTAAYRFRGNKEYIAELAIGKAEPNWWVYRQLPSKTADPNITMWAFARRPHCCRYPVVMYRNGAWRPYEYTYAWGRGLGADAIGAMAAAAGYSDVIKTSEIRADISGTNSVKLLDAIKAAMRTRSVGLVVDDTLPPITEGNRIEVTSRPTQVGPILIRHRIIAIVEPAGDQISIEFSSQGFAEGRDFPVAPREQEALFQNLKTALTQPPL